MIELDDCFSTTIDVINLDNYLQWLLNWTGESLVGNATMEDQADNTWKHKSIPAPVNKVKPDTMKCIQRAYHCLRRCFSLKKQLKVNQPLALNPSWTGNKGMGKQMSPQGSNHSNPFVNGTNDLVSLINQWSLK